MAAREGRRGGRSERPDLLEVGRAYRPRASWGSLIVPRRPRWSPNRTDEHTSGDRRAAAAAVHRPGDRRDHRPAAVDGVGDPQRIGMGKLGRLGLEPAVRYERARPGELIHIDVKKLGRIHGGAGKRITGGKRHTTTRRHRRSGRLAQESAGTTCTSPSTTPPAWPTPRSWPTRGETAVAFLRRALVLCPSRHPRRARDHRQRLALPLHRARDRLPRPRAAAPTHPPLPPTDQRQSRALHPHPARRLGLRPIYGTNPERTKPLTAGSGTTTIAGDTAPSATSRPSHG